MLVAIDIGNTNITIGGFCEERLEFTARIATDSKKTADQYSVELKQIFELKEVYIENIKSAIICSVVPGLQPVIKTAMQLLKCENILLLGPGIKTGLNIKIDNPAQLGADIVAGAVGALSKYDMPCIVIDMGTASTITVLDKTGACLGGAIAAGPNLTLESLTQRTAQLPSINIESPKSVIGTNTIDSMKSGLVFGSAAMIDGMVKRIERQLDSKASVIATGGLAKEIIKCCDTNIIFDENLLLYGLKIIFEKNK